MGDLAEGDADDAAVRLEHEAPGIVDIDRAAPHERAVRSGRLDIATDRGGYRLPRLARPVKGAGAVGCVHRPGN